MRKRIGWTIRLVALAIVAMGLAWGGYRVWTDSRREFSPAQVPRLRPVPLTIVPGISMLGGLTPSASYVVESARGLILIDTGLRADASLVKSQMRTLGLDWTRVRAIFLTHVHGDHTGGAAHLRGATGATVYAGRGDAPVLRAGTPREAFFSTFYMPDDVPHPTPVDVELAGGETLSFGDVRVRAVAAPGHTPGSVCYLVERRGLRVLFGGDVVMMLHGDDVPNDELRKPLGTYSAYLAPCYRGDASSYEASLKALKRLPVPDLVLPGHPGADPSPQSPCLTQTQWEAMLDRGIRDMETLLARYEADGRDFLDGNPKRLLPDLYYFGEFRGAAVYGVFAGSRFLLVDAPGGKGLTAFVTDRLRALGLGSRVPTAVLLTSCGPEATSGLSELVETWHPQVITTAEGISTLKAVCPSETAWLTTDEFSSAGWLEVTPIPLLGRGLAPVAYRFPWAGKTVLISGRLPIKVNQETGLALFSDVAASRADMRGFLASILRLGPKPDLWLPAVPVDGQNANLYDHQWEKVLVDNVQAIQRIAAALNPPGPR